jgi:small-conductance mechanosensitive channel
VSGNWPELTLAAAVAIVAAYLVADVVSRVIQSILRGIIADPHRETLFVDRPRRVVRLVIFIVTAAALLLPAMRMAGFSTRMGGDPEGLARWALDTGLRIAIIAVAAYAAIRIGSAAGRRLEREMSAGTGLDAIERTKRAQTLSRLLQKTLSITVTLMAGLMILREFDVDITPVLAGAGIVGIAIGFGAQTLMRDLISGFFLILENQVRVGDVAVVNGQGGLVEEVNLRTTILRDESGAVHVFANGEIKTLSNLSKDFSYYVVTVNVGYSEDPERVESAMRDAAASMLDDPKYRTHILEPMEVYGVDAFEAGHMLIKGRIKTVPLKQWTVGRELRKRIARTFRERSIHIPVPQVSTTVATQPPRPEGARSVPKSEAER